MVGTEGGSGREIVGEEMCVVDRAGRAEVGRMCGRRVVFTRYRPGQLYVLMRRAQLKEIEVAGGGGVDQAEDQRRVMGLEQRWRD